MEFDEDIAFDVRKRNIEELAYTAQDLRNILSHVAPRSLLAALKRKKKAEEVS